MIRKDFDALDVVERVDEGSKFPQIFIETVYPGTSTCLIQTGF